MYQIQDGTVLDSNGKIIFYSVNRFIEDICKSDRCFICGKSSAEITFTKEHILPKWILRKYKLYDKIIGLPNYSSFRYSKYVIPCCKNCNQLLNKKLEQPIKKLIDSGYSDFIKYLRREGPYELFVWLNLIFLKTHLKDKSLKLHLKEISNIKISDFYTWEDLHHIHCIARSFYTNADLEKEVLGSILILPVKKLKHIESFDYFDLYDSKSILLRVNDIGIIAVLNDSCLAQNTISDIINIIDNEISPLQLREIFARLSFGNNILNSHPEFSSNIDLTNESYIISATIPTEVGMLDYEIKKFGNIMFYCCDDWLDKRNENEYNILRKNIESGNYTFIINSEGKFVSDSMDMLL